MSSTLIPSTVAQQNITIDPRAPHMEVFNTKTGDVWLYQSPINEEQFKSFKPEPPFMKSGIGRSAMDIAYFLRSPGAKKDGAVETRMIGGLMWSRVAKPINFRGFNSGPAPTRINVEKHHVIGFDAGTQVKIARLSDGLHYIQQTATASDQPDVDPEDWEIFTLTLDRSWSIYLNCPVTVYFFRNLRSFAGPFTADQLPGLPRKVGKALAA